MSGTALIGAAVVAFVLLVSAQAFRDWPLSALPSVGASGGGANGSIAPASPVPGTGTEASGAGTAAGGAADGANGASGSPNRQSGVGRPGGAAGEQVGGSPTVTAPATGGPGSGSTPVAGSSPSASPSGGGGGGGGGKTGSGGGGGSSTSGQVTGTVNDTVSGVDKATGGSLGDTGVTKVTEDAVSGAAGPESTVGKTVDRAAGTVGGVLGADD